MENVIVDMLCDHLCDKCHEKHANVIVNFTLAPKYLCLDCLGVKFVVFLGVEDRKGAL